MLMSADCHFVRPERLQLITMIPDQEMLRNAFLRSVSAFLYHRRLDDVH